MLKTVSGDTKVYLALGVVAIALGYMAYRALRGVVSGAADIAATKLNPLSDQNVIYHDLIGGVGRSVSGDQNWNLGGSIYEATHPNATFENPQKPFCTNFLGIGCPDNSEGRDVPFLDN